MPIILAGGVGKYHHLSKGLKDERVDAVATAHLFLEDRTYNKQA